MNEDLGGVIKNEETQAKSWFDKIKYYLIITVLFVIILLMRECQNSRDKVRLIKNVSSYSDSSKHYKNKLGEQVNYNQTLDFESKQQLKAYFAKNDSLTKALKNFKTIVSVVTEKEYVYIHDTVGIKYETKIPCVFKPFDVIKDTTYYRFRGTIFQDKFKIDSLLIPNIQTIVVGTKKTGFFKSEQRVEVTNTNPFLKTTNLGAYTIKQSVKRVGIGFYVGYGVGFNKGNIYTSPSFGFSISYNFLLF